MRCVGVGKCRHDSRGVMCPSYMVTREEEHSTRGRSRLLFEMLESHVLRDLLTVAGGIDKRRTIPLFAPQTLQAWVGGRDPGAAGTWLASTGCRYGRTARRRRKRG